MKNLVCMSLSVASLLLSVGTLHAMEGQKLDSGLGELPHYSQWADRTGRLLVAVVVPGESLDDSLGDLPPYRLWKDPTGRDPLGTRAARIAAAPR